MTAQIRSEIQKITSVRTTWVFLIATAGFVALMVGVQSATAGSEFLPPLDDPGTQLAVLQTGSIAPIIAIVFGCLAVTTELRHHTIVSTLLVEPDRGRMLAAKVVATALAGAVLAAVAVGLAVGGTLAVLALTSTPVVVANVEVAASAAGIIGGAALGAVFGLGVGGIVRNQALAVGTVLAVLLALEPLVGSLLPQVAAWMPSSLIALLGGAESPDQHAWWLLALALAGYAAVASIGAALTLRRADIT